MKRGILQRAHNSLGQLVRLAFLAVGATLGFAVVLLLGNLVLFSLAQIVNALFDLVRFLFGGQ